METLSINNYVGIWFTKKDSGVYFAESQTVVINNKKEFCIHLICSTNHYDVSEEELLNNWEITKSPYEDTRKPFCLFN